MKTIIKWVLLGVGAFALFYIYSPKLAMDSLIKVIPERFLIPHMSDSTYVHTETDFFEKLRLIHGEFDVADSCIYNYTIPFKGKVPVVVTTTGKVSFYVNIDTSIIQINNSSKTFLLDTAGIQLQYMTSDYRIDHKIRGDLSLPESDVKRQMAQCNEYFNNNIKNSKQLIAAKQSLDQLINSQLLFLIQKGYENRSSRN